jgi:small subunit ribosomal protein S8
MSIDTIGDFLTVIRNGVKSSKRLIYSPYSKMKYNIAQILKEEGFISDVIIEEKDERKYIKVLLKYFNGNAVIHEINRSSKPGCRVYVGSKNIEPVISGLGLAILTTNKGIMSDKKAKQLLLGGELICTIW